VAASLLLLGWCWLGWHWLGDGLISGPLGVLMDGRPEVPVRACPALPLRIVFLGSRWEGGGGRGNGVLGVGGGLCRSLYHSCHCRTWRGFDAPLGRSRSWLQRAVMARPKTTRTRLVPVT
jgi:hypothetical protein